MRLRYIWVRAGSGEGCVRESIETTSQDFLETMQYAQHQFSDQEDFLSRCCGADWISEVHEVLRQWLPSGETILSLGSGLGEHEILLFRLGYDVTASDFVKHACNEARRLFPGFRAITLDILKPETPLRFDVILLLGGFDQYFDDIRLQQAFQNVRGLLKPRGRMVVALRHHDNLCTRLIDYILWPILAKMQNVRCQVQGRKERWTRKIHAYARRRREIIRIAQRAGYTVGRIDYAGFGVEWTRLAVDAFFPRLFGWLRSLDRRLHCCNNVTLFEFLV